MKWTGRASSIAMILLSLCFQVGAAETTSVPCYATGFYFGGAEPLERKFEREAAISATWT